MKNLLLSLFTTFFLIGIATAQEAKVNQKFNEFLSKNLHYSKELRGNEVQGAVSALLTFDSEGKIASTPEILAGDEQLAEEVIRVVQLMQVENKADLITSEYNGQGLILNVEFRISSGNSQQINLPNTELKILKNLNSKISKNPYFPSYYLERARLYDELDKRTLAHLDRAFYRELKEKELSTVVVVGYKASHKKLSLSTE
ncbi:hypothetical protein SAMN04488104_101916 [Algoriphagus faecimaris]|uniref:TonB protein C-terminal n=1 Tax=Algoriphagus faecimaris TaxID=686796 RepID=A0A1G6SVX5_9BACT|nr:hypothetical protein [Algoriphagus faecimaris]SDD20949.1 hypothetical protein SAMN04488104_101916 [Algoriphagus faecimaris]